ncbi:replication initiator [Saccharothrix syringae]|uniref:replication initiator n=1 Tax=Saccharothrix syringae TaxID=103733 RepID=UPI000526DAAD|nr:replication initiator [Saccharothrix syringae]
MTTGTRAERMRQPMALDVAKAAAEQHGVCVRPFTMEVEDRTTYEVRYVAVPCGSTVESTCAPCARKAKALRMAQCREGWHLTEEPDFTPVPPTQDQTELLTFRVDLVKAYRDAVEAGEAGHADELREEIHSVDAELRQLGVRGRLPSPDAPDKRSVKRSTKRRQDAPDLPRRRVEKRTVGREYAGGFRPSMFVTLTLDTYGKVRDDGTPVDPNTYDYRRAARDAVHFASLVDRWWQNLRRVVGWDVQYFATVESGDHLPVWDARAEAFVDPDTRRPLTPWAEAVARVEEPAHVVRFGRQVHSKGILGGSQEAGRHIGYLTKYLTKSIGEVVEQRTDRQRRHADRLADELAVTPCSERCPVWLLYGVQPRGANSRTTPGHCKGRAHRRTTLGLPGRRVLVSRKWSGKTLADHRADRKRFVLEALKAVGIEKPEQDTAQLVWHKVRPGDPNVPPRAHLLMHAIAQRVTWRAEYDRALLAATGSPDLSATQLAA